MGVDQFDNPTYVIMRFSDERANITAGAFSQAAGAFSITENVSDGSECVRVCIYGEECVDVCRRECGGWGVYGWVGLVRCSYI